MISRIGHVGLCVPDIERSVAFAEQVLGLRVTDTDSSATYLTCNARHHELILFEGRQPACHHLAFEIFDPRVFRDFRYRLDRLGLDALDGWSELGVQEAVHLLAPGGFVIEVFHGMAADEPERYDTVGVRPRKFEHITLKSAAKEELEEFLQGVLGMRLSDRAADQISWFRANEEHHGLSVIRADVNQLQHYAWQVDWESIRRVGDHLIKRGSQFVWGPGHHGIGDNYFCYFHDADGVIVEYSADIQRIENELSYEARVWPDDPLSVNQWGNPEPPPAFLNGGIPLYTEVEAHAPS